MKAKIAIVLSIFLLFSAVSFAKEMQGDITVEADGYGSSRDEALLYAKRGAIESGIGTFLVSQTEVNNFVLQKDVVITKTAGSVKKYKVLKEEKQEGDTYYVKIEAVVSLDSIKADLAALKILLESMDKPRMMVLVQEEGGNFAENAVLDYLTEKEFDLVDAAAVAALMQKGDQLIQRATEGDPVAAAKLGAANGAEYVLVGKVTKGTMSNSLLNSSGIQSGQASMTAKVVNCSNARVIASKSANGAAVHASIDTAQAQAATKAAKKLMDKSLFEKIVSSFQDMANNGMTFELTVNNVSNFSMQKAATKALSELPNVVSVNRRSFGGGQLKLSVLFKGNADSFCNAVDGKTVSGKKLFVTDVAGSRIAANLE